MYLGQARKRINRALVNRQHFQPQLLALFDQKVMNRFGKVEFIAFCFDDDFSRGRNAQIDWIRTIVSDIIISHIARSRMNILPLQHALLERRSGIAAQPGDHDLCAYATDTLRRSPNSNLESRIAARFRGGWPGYRPARATWHSCGKKARDSNKWLDRQSAESIWIASITVFEAHFGIALLPKGKRQRSQERRLFR